MLGKVLNCKYVYSEESWELGSVDRTVETADKNGLL